MSRLILRGNLEPRLYSVIWIRGYRRSSRRRPLQPSPGAAASQPRTDVGRVIVGPASKWAGHLSPAIRQGRDRRLPGCEHNVALLRGTDGSNPSPSSEESGANLPRCDQLTDRQTGQLLDRPSPQCRRRKAVTSYRTTIPRKTPEWHFAVRADWGTPWPRPRH
jgi:hypothetical protein